MQRPRLAFFPALPAAPCQHQASQEQPDPIPAHDGRRTTPLQPPSRVNPCRDEQRPGFESGFKLADPEDPERLCDGW